MAMSSSYLAPAPRQLDIVADTILAEKNQGELSTAGKPKNQGELSTYNIKTLETRRIKHRIPIAKLCANAGIHTDTYDDARKGSSATRQATYEKINRALNQLVAGADVDVRRTLCQATLRLVTAQLARNTGWDPQLMLAQDFSAECPQNPVWKQAARLRRCAIYLLVEGLGLGKAEIGHAIGMTRAGAQKAVKEIEAERDRSVEFDALMQNMMVQLKGEM